MKNPWSQRNLFIKEYIPENSSIIDYGCGNKEILDFYRPKKYLGIDILEDADIVMDLNDPREITEKYDVGLILGLLEYLDNPDFTLDKIKYTANKFLILTCNSKKKKEWKKSFNKDQIEKIVKTHFKKVETFSINGYTLIKAEEPK